MTRIHLAATCAAALLGIMRLSPALAAEKGWYVGAGAGLAYADIKTSSINQQLSVMNPGATTTSISKDNTGLLYKLFLGYNFSSFVALEANGFWLDGFGFSANTSPPGTYSGSSEAGGASLDVLGIVPLDEHWRIFGRAGVIYAQTTSTLNTSIGSVTSGLKSRDYDIGYKFGAGVGYEFDSGVAFRAEWEQYHVSDAMDGELVANVYSASFLYRFK